LVEEIFLISTCKVRFARSFGAAAKWKGKSMGLKRSVGKKMCGQTDGIGKDGVGEVD
jgi:hypothetical protein